METTRLHAQLVKRLANAGLTDYGAQFVASALSPADGSALKMPDERTCPSVVQRFIEEATVSAPSTGSWDCLIIKPPSDSIAAIIATKDAVTSPEEFNVAPAGSVTLQVLYNTNYTSLGVSASVVAGTIPDFASAVVLASELLFSQWRLGASSLTVTNTSSSLSDGGTVYASQYSRALPPTFGTFINGATAGPSSNQMLMTPCWAIDLPMSSSEMSKLAARGLYTTKAKHGAYVPCLPSGDDHPFVVPPSANLPFAREYAGGGTWGGGILAVNQALAESQGIEGTLRFLNGTTGSNGFVPWSVGNQASTTYGAPNSFFTSGVDTSVAWGVTLFEGLPADGTLSVKAVSTLEYIPLDVSPGRSFLTPAPMYDERAMAMLARLAAEQAHAYPAKDNFLGGLMSLIGRAASTLAGPVLSLFQNPGVRSAVSTVAQDTLKSVGSSAAAAAENALKRQVDKGKSQDSKERILKAERELAAAKAAIRGAERTV